jgi:hypothetical protein
MVLERLKWACCGNRPAIRKQGTSQTCRRNSSSGFIHIYSQELAVVDNIQLLVTCVWKPDGFQIGDWQGEMYIALSKFGLQRLPAGKRKPETRMK